MAGMPNYRTALSQGPDPQRARVKMIGVGSAGCNIIEGAQFPAVAFSASTADIARSHAERKVLVGQDRLLGLSESNPEMLRQIQEVVGHELFDLFNNTEIAFLMCGLGGVTGSLGTRLLCSIAKSKGAAPAVLAATPFSVESHRRRELAEASLRSLLGAATMCIEFDNDKLSALAPNLALSRAFGLLNGIMLRPVIDLCACVARDDMPQLRQAIGSSNYGRFGLGMARGDERVERVVSEALSSPWFDYDITQAKAAIVVYSAADPWDKEMERILGNIETKLASTNLLWGSYQDPSLGERIRLSVLLFADYGLAKEK